MEKNVLITAIGNEIRGDDGLPFYIIDRIKDKIKYAEVIKTSEAGLNLVDMFDEYTKVIIIDTIKSPEFKIGEIISYTFNKNDVKNETGLSHNRGILSVLKLYSLLGIGMPGKIKFILINIKENDQFKSEFSTDYDFTIKKILRRLKNKNSF